MKQRGRRGASTTVTNNREESPLLFIRPLIQFHTLPGPPRSGCPFQAKSWGAKVSSNKRRREDEFKQDNFFALCEQIFPSHILLLEFEIHLISVVSSYSINVINVWGIRIFFSVCLFCLNDEILIWLHNLPSLLRAARSFHHFSEALKDVPHIVNLLPRHR